MGKYIELQEEIIKRYNITIDENSKCRSRMHIHVRERRICKWHPKNSAFATFELLHEIGHAENNNSKMRRCEEEYYATLWAIERCNEYGVPIDQKTLDAYQRYIDMELNRGIIRHASGLPSKEELTLPGARRKLA